MSRPTQHNSKSNVPSLHELKGIFQASGLKNKILFTIIAILIYRLGVQIPIWGVVPGALEKYLGGLGGLLNMFSGGALGSLSVLALGIGPYITSSIIMQLMTVVIPRLEEMQKEEGEQGRKKLSQITRYGTVILAVLQGSLIIRLIAGSSANLLPGVDPTMFWIAGIVSLTAGAVFALWLAEIITEKGIGNGGSLLIFIGILASVPTYVEKTRVMVAGDNSKIFLLLILLAIFLALIALIIILQEAARNVFVVNAKRQIGNKVYGGQNTHIPFKINPAGVMPIIFAFAVMAFPATVFQMSTPLPDTWLYDVKNIYDQYFGFSGSLYGVVMFVMVIFFSFFYASIIPSMQPKEIAENLKKYGASIPGIKPGKPTAEKLEEILTRIIWIGAFALAGITLAASSAPILLKIPTLAGLGATSLIILVGVALDTVNQIRVHLLSRQYQGFMK